MGRGIAPDWTTPPTVDTTTHYRYQDGLGNAALRPTRILVTDPVGNRTTTERDIAEATTAVIEPPNGAGDPNPTGRVSTVTTYPYLGGPAVETQQLDGSGQAIREAHRFFGKAGEVAGVRGAVPPGQPNAGQIDVEPEDYGYDAAYRRTSQKQYPGDPTSTPPSVTTYGYDFNGQVKSIQYPSDSAASEMDGYTLTLGTATRTIGGIATTETYGSPSGQLSAVIHSDGTSSVSYLYDAYDRLTTLTTDVAGGQSYVQQRYAYDDADDGTQATTTDGALPALTMAYSYNPDGSRQSLDFRKPTDPEPAGLGKLVYGWDPEERLSVLLDTNDFRFAEWSYRKDDRVQTALGSTLATTRKGYTPRGLLASLKLSPFTIPARSSIYAGPSGLETDPMRYDASGRRTGLTVTGPEFPGSASYSYDAFGRSTQETPQRAGAPQAIPVTHAYDLAGNHWYTGVVNNQTMDWYEFDGMLGGIDPFSPSGPAPFNPDNQIAPWSYDPFGDLTGTPSRSYTFDAEERLTRVTDGSGSTLMSAGYQGDGRRAWKADGSGNRAYFVYDGDDPIIEQAPDGDGGARVTAVNLFGAEGLLSRRARQSDGIPMLGSLGSYRPGEVETGWPVSLDKP